VQRSGTYGGTTITPQATQWRHYFPHLTHDAAPFGAWSLSLSYTIRKFRYAAHTVIHISPLRGSLYGKKTIYEYVIAGNKFLNSLYIFQLCFMQ